MRSNSVRCHPVWLKRFRVQPRVHGGEGLDGLHKLSSEEEGLHPARTTPTDGIQLSILIADTASEPNNVNRKQETPEKQRAFLGPDQTRDLIKSGRSRLLWETTYALKLSRAEEILETVTYDEKSIRRWRIPGLPCGFHKQRCRVNDEAMPPTTHTLRTQLRAGA